MSAVLVPFIRRSGFGIAVAFALLLGEAELWADVPRDPSAASALFKEGRAAVVKGDYATACARFRDSERLDPALGTEFNLADCEERLGHLIMAKSLFERVARSFSAGDDRLPIAKQHIESLDRRLPRLVIRLAAGVKDASVTRDGVALDAQSIGSPLALDPGGHMVVVAAPGHEPQGFTIDAKENATAEILVAPGKALAPQDSTPAASSSKPSSRRTIGFVLGGVGVVGVAVGAVTGILALGDKSTVLSSCNAGEQCKDQAGVDAAKSGHTVSTISTIGFAAGFVALGAGVALVLTSHDGGKAAIAPAIAPNAAGFRLSSSF